MKTTKGPKELVVGVFGRRMTGKTNLMASLGADVNGAGEPGAAEEAVVRVKGLGPVRLIKPLGLDDERALGIKSTQSRDLLSRLDAAILVIDASLGWSDYERFLLSKIRFSENPEVVVINRCADESCDDLERKLRQFGSRVVHMDLDKVADPASLITALIAELHLHKDLPNLLDGLVKEGESVWLVVPSGRKNYHHQIEPHEYHLKLDAQKLAASLDVVLEADFASAWEKASSPPRLVICDHEVLDHVQRLVPRNLPLTTLDILTDRQRGELATFVQGAETIKSLKAGDRILITSSSDLEIQPDDHSRNEMPSLLRTWVRGDLEFSLASGEGLESGLDGVDLAVRCEPTTHDRADGLSDVEVARRKNVPITSYGVAFAYVHGVLTRLVKPFVSLGEFSAPDVDLTRALPLVLHDEYSSMASM